MTAVVVFAAKARNRLAARTWNSRSLMPERTRLLGFRLEFECKLHPEGSPRAACVQKTWQAGWGMSSFDQQADKPPRSFGRNVRRDIQHCNYRLST
jgi:hypothetical protein